MNHHSPTLALTAAFSDAGNRIRGYGRESAEYERLEEAVQTFSYHPRCYIDFMVLDDMCAPAFRRGDLVVLDTQRSQFVDGAHYAFDFDEFAAPLGPGGYVGAPLRFYPSLWQVRRTLKGLSLCRSDGEAETITNDAAQRYCIGRAVACFQLLGRVS